MSCETEHVYINVVNVQLSQLHVFNFFSQKNVADLKTGSTFTYSIDLCNPLNCNTDHAAECVSYLTMY